MRKSYPFLVGCVLTDITLVACQSSAARGSIPTGGAPGIPTSGAPAPLHLGEHEVVVNPNSYSSVKFDVPAGVPEWVAGHFEAKGGSGNDIHVMLMDADSFPNFQNHHAFKSYFASSKETAGTLNVGPLAPGTNYLIFDNSNSLVSNKVVENNIQMQAFRPQ